MRKLAVINTYKDAVTWAPQLNFDYIIYNKYDPLIDEQYWKYGYENTYEYYKRLYSIPGYLEIMNPVSTDIPNLVSNVGHDSYTFFNHIINNYDDPADMTVFLHCTPFHHCDDIINRLNCLNGDHDFVDFGTLMTSDTEGGPTDRCPVGPIFQQLFPDKEVPSTFLFTSGSLFAVSRALILRHSKVFYEHCRGITQTEPLAPWAFERLYRTIFTG